MPELVSCKHWWHCTKTGMKNHWGKSIQRGRGERKKKQQKPKKGIHSSFQMFVQKFPSVTTSTRLSHNVQKVPTDLQCIQATSHSQKSPEKCSTLQARPERPPTTGLLVYHNHSCIAKPSGKARVTLQLEWFREMQAANEHRGALPRQATGKGGATQLAVSADPPAKLK